MENEGKRIYGQNCFPVTSLLPGIKFVPMRTNGGELIPESGIFVRIKKSEGVSGSESMKLARNAKAPNGSPNHVGNHRTQPAGQALSEEPKAKAGKVAEEETIEVEVHFQ